MIHWKKLTELSQVTDLQQSGETAMIFKHSSRCSISLAVLNRLERAWNAAEMHQLTPYFLDLLTYRSVSDKIAEQFSVKHESPQVLIILKGKLVYHSSHFDIGYDQLRAVIKN